MGKHRKMCGIARGHDHVPCLCMHPQAHDQSPEDDGTHAVDAVVLKHATEGSEEATAAAERCSVVMMEEYHWYIAKTKDELTDCKQGSEA